jgi:hypothetical protein
MVSEYKCKKGILSACESCKHAETEPGKEPCRGCIKERKCPYFAFPGDCSGCRWEPKGV